ncbi:MAG TPA: energy-coupling factor ABC transporter ATP-binding protein [Methanoregulaceae archaeon]|nr:energy-coupling factor ABC transporter ATP-binding protein [Methanoregulaceae archaeon]
MKNLFFERVVFARGGFRLNAEGIFGPGIHLVSGRVGSGKSTFSLLAAGLISPESGEIRREELSRTMLSMQFPEYHITGISIGDEIRSWGLEVPGILGNVRLNGRENDDIATLSRGELKRLHLSCVLSTGADLLILDEPFSSLDCSEKKSFSSAIAGYGSGIVIICTHEPLWLPDVDCIWEIQDGSLVCCGKTPEGITRWGSVPVHIRNLLAKGIVPENISPRALLEARCRTRE